jgi:hypothetical protein
VKTRARSTRSTNATQNEEERGIEQEQLSISDEDGDSVRGSSGTTRNDSNAESLGRPWSLLAPVAGELRRLEAIPGRTPVSQGAEVRGICERIRFQTEQRDDEPALVDGLRVISSQIAELRDKHRDDQNESKKLLLYLRDVLLHLIPGIVRLLLSIIERYAVLDSSPRGPVVDFSTNQVVLISELCADIVALGNDLHEKEKPRRFMNAYKVYMAPIRRNIIKPIRSMMEILLVAIKEARRAEEHDCRARIIREEEAHRRQSEALQEEYQRARKRKHTEWQELHKQRRFTERGFLSLAKQILLAYVELVDQELDANGLPFERVDVFAPLRVRVGPSPEQMQSARGKSWSAQQEQDLMAGLEEYAGDDVLIHIFARYCRNSLAAFSVSDIVTRAADLKERRLREYEESQEIVPAWIKQIPVWTRPHAVGKENEEQVEHQDESL